MRNKLYPVSTSTRLFQGGRFRVEPRNAFAALRLATARCAAATAGFRVARQRLFGDPFQGGLPRGGAAQKRPHSLSMVALHLDLKVARTPV